MATKTPPKTKTGKLNKKIGPLPLKVWIGIGALVFILLFVYMKRKNKDSSVDGSTEAGGTDLSPYTATVSPQQAASAGSPSPNSPVYSQLDPDTLAALGQSIPGDYVTSTDLASQLDSLGANFNSSIAALTLSSPTPSASKPAAAKTPAATKTATGASVAKTNSPGNSTATRYYTYAPGVKTATKGGPALKGNQLLLKAGQKLGYRPGKGYYAI